MKYQALRPQFFSMGGWGVGVVCGVIRLSFQSNLISQKLPLWCKKKIMNTKAFFLCWEGSNLILGIGTENQIFILRTPVTIKFFHQILKNCHSGIKKYH